MEVIKVNKDKEIRHFVRKYIWDEKNLDMFVKKLSPSDCYGIVKRMFDKGMTFTWFEDYELPDELKLKTEAKNAKMSVQRKTSK